MRLNATDTIAGFGAKEVRTLLRNVHDGITQAIAARILSTTPTKAKRLIAELLRLELLCPSPTQWKSETAYVRTIAGNAYAMARMTPPSSRATADRLYAEFMQRVEALNQSSEFLHRVRRVALFGSYITDAATVNDIDVAIDMERRIEDGDAYLAAGMAMVRAEEQAGRRFSSYSDVLDWPVTKAKRFLRGRSNRISLHTFKDMTDIGADHRIVYDETMQGENK